MEEFCILHNNKNKFNNLYLKISFLIKMNEFIKNINIKEDKNVEMKDKNVEIKDKDVEIKDKNVERVVKNVEMKNKNIERVVKNVETVIDNINIDVVKIKNDIIEKELKEECKKNLEYSNKIDTKVNGKLTPLNLENNNVNEENIQYMKDKEYKERLNEGLKDVDIGCGICCNGCKNILKYVYYNLKKCFKYIIKKICKKKIN